MAVHSLEVVLLLWWIVSQGRNISPVTAGCATSVSALQPVSVSIPWKCGQLSWSTVIPDLGSKSILQYIMLLFVVLKVLWYKTHVVVAGLSGFLCWPPITLKWLGLKMFVRPLMYFISLKVGKCPASDWWFFGACSDILLSWDGEGSYIWICSSIPCAAKLLLASSWLLLLHL